jgi:hypothetical protein
MPHTGIAGASGGSPPVTVSVSRARMMPHMRIAGASGGSPPVTVSVGHAQVMPHMGIAAVRRVRSAKHDDDPGVYQAVAVLASVIPCDSSQRSASIAALQPSAAAVTAWR